MIVPLITAALTICNQTGKNERGWGYAVYLYSLKFFRIKFLSEFLSSLLIGIAAIYSVRFGLGSNQDLIIIGCVMPLVPGQSIKKIKIPIKI